MSMFNTFTNRLSRLHQDISKELEGALSSSPTSEPAPRPPSPLGPKQKLFDDLLMVELEQIGETNVPVVKEHWPSREVSSESLHKQVVQFCFPDASDFPRSHLRKFFSTASSLSETFSFVMTETDGSRRFGYCRRTLLPSRWPRCLCVLSLHPCFSIFDDILKEVEGILAHGKGTFQIKAVGTFIQSILDEPFPEPGQTIEVTVLSFDKGGETMMFPIHRPDDAESMLQFTSFDDVLQHMPSVTIVSVFASILVERRAIFVASQLSTLTSCINAFIALLYPFTWQHVFIPVLPPSLLSYCCAPMPFVVGILRSSLQEVIDQPLDTVLVVDLDAGSATVRLGEFENPETFVSDYDLMPERLREELLSSVRKVKQNKSADSHEKKTAFSQAFLYCIVGLINGLYEYMGTSSKGVYDMFHRDEFLNNSDPQVRQYLESVVHSQMFDMFVESRMHTLKKKQHDGVPPARLFAPRSSSSFDMMMSFYQAQAKSEKYKKEAEEGEKERQKAVTAPSIGVPFNFRQNHHLNQGLKYSQAESVGNMGLKSLTLLCIEFVLKRSRQYEYADVLRLPVCLHKKFSVKPPTEWKASQSNKLFNRTNAASYAPSTSRSSRSSRRSSNPNTAIEISGPYNMRHKAHVGSTMNELKLDLLAQADSDQSMAVARQYYLFRNDSAAGSQKESEHCRVM